MRRIVAFALGLLVVSTLSAAALVLRDRLADPRTSAEERVLRAAELRRNPNVQFAALNEIVASNPRRTAEASLAVLEENPSGERRYAAAYVLALTAERAEEIEALGHLLDDRQPHLRALAAGALAGLGETRALPALIELIPEREPIPYSEPELEIDDFALRTLAAYTGQRYGLEDAGTLADRVEASREWSRWWREVGDILRWNAGSKRYEP